MQANTNWYAERSWPVFVLNVLRFLAGAAEASGAPSYPPGETVRLRLESAVDEVSVFIDEDESNTLAPSPGGVVEVVTTDLPGNYSIRDDDRILNRFAINLFDRKESQIATAKTVELGYDTVEGATGEIEQRKEFWRWLLLGMLGLLAAEWWYYGRRIA
ncbi:MAG: hypothetical protein AAF989_09650 [Planctomycetota bacterium]